MANLLDNNSFLCRYLITDDCEETIDDLFFQIVAKSQGSDSESESTHSGSSSTTTTSLDKGKHTRNSSQKNVSIKGKSRGLDLDVIIIGPNGTQVRRKDYETIKWVNPSSATRKLLTFVFEKKDLATHSFTGKRSVGRPLKKPLDSMKTEDIINLVGLECNVDSQYVRRAISMKCVEMARSLGKKLERSDSKLKAS